MSGRRILFLGGTGVISSASVRRALTEGHEVTILTRGTSPRAVADGAETLRGDVRDPDSLREALAAREFDVVADFLTFVPSQLESVLPVIEDRAGQYIFVSSASAYEKPPRYIPVTESTPLRNPFWQYSRDKIACEDILVAAHRDRGLPMTIVRPSHTYDRTMIPTLGKWNDIARLRAGRPVVIHGDGTSLWTITHADDVAVGFVALFGNGAAFGEAFTITGSHAPTWNQIYGWLADAAGVADPRFVHVTSDEIAARAPALGPGLRGDKSHSMVFDNSRIRALAPDFRTTVTFDEGARRIVAHYDAHPELQVVDPALEAVFDDLTARTL